MNTHHIKSSNMLAWFGVVGAQLGEVRGSVTPFGIYGIQKYTHYRKYREVHKNYSKYFSNKYDKKLDKNLKRTEKESLKNSFLFKSYKGFNPGTRL